MVNGNGYYKRLFQHFWNWAAKIIRARKDPDLWISFSDIYEHIAPEEVSGGVES